jgi:hypothetical protein
LENTIAIRARFRSVGTTRPVSNCDRKLAESPVCLPSSTRPMDFFSRSRLIRSPIRFSAITRAVVSVSTCDLCVSSLRTTAFSAISPPPRTQSAPENVARIKNYSHPTKVPVSPQSMACDM